MADGPPPTGGGPSEDPTPPGAPVAPPAEPMKPMKPITPLAVPGQTITPPSEPMKPVKPVVTPITPTAPRPEWTRESSVLRLTGVDSLEDLSPQWAWGGSTGKGVRVAVIDSGVEADHPDLGSCVDADGGVTVTLDESGEPIITTGPHDDAFGHGTACAGIIHRLAPEARITSVRVLGAGLSGKANVFIAGLAWAIEQGFDVINLSLGTTKRDWALPFYEVCDRGYFRGSFLVTAANNMARPSFPSLYASVTSVACNLSADPFRFHYNPDPPTEFLAPGIDVEVSWRGGTRMTSTGNSYAAPHLAGIAALIKSKHPGLRPFQLKTVLWATAANVVEAPKAAGRLTNVVQAVGHTMAGPRATSALQAVRGPASAP